MRAELGRITPWSVPYGQCSTHAEMVLENTFALAKWNIEVHSVPLLPFNFADQYCVTFLEPRLWMLRAAGHQSHQKSLTVCVHEKMKMKNQYGVHSLPSISQVHPLSYLCQVPRTMDTNDCHIITLTQHQGPWHASWLHSSQLVSVE